MLKKPSAHPPPGERSASAAPSPSPPRRGPSSDHWALPPDSPLRAASGPIRPKSAPRPPVSKVVREHFCYRCGTPWLDQFANCTSCGASDRGVDEARPLHSVEGDTKLFPGPWQMVPWPRQGAVVLAGGPGSGKSSLSALIRPTLWLTKEQQPKPVGEMFRRLLPPECVPVVTVVNSAEDVRNALSKISYGPVVVDSLTALGLKEGLAAGLAVVEWARRRNDRALAICQVITSGDMAGYNQIPHLFDAVIFTSADPQGVRRMQVTKSRWSALGASYWSFDGDGRIDTPDFDASYSVEGKPGNYYLHPFPVRGAKWAGMLGVAAESGDLRPGYASAAVAADYMPNGFLFPTDIYERQHFAERHGLAWLSPSDIEDRDGD